MVTGPDGKTQKLADLLDQSPQTTLDLPIALGKRKSVICRLLAAPVPANVADQRRRRLRDEARRRQQPVSSAALLLAGWTVMVTNAPAGLLTVVRRSPSCASVGRSNCSSSSGRTSA